MIINAMTRLRICTADGRMEFSHKGRLEDIPKGYIPWFAVPGRRAPTARSSAATGRRWACGRRTNLLALDTGCLWGRTPVSGAPGGPADIPGQLPETGRLSAVAIAALGLRRARSRRVLPVGIDRPAGKSIPR